MYQSARRHIQKYVNINQRWYEKLNFAHVKGVFFNRGNIRYSRRSSVTRTPIFPLRCVFQSMIQGSGRSKTLVAVDSEGVRNENKRHRIWTLINSRECARYKHNFNWNNTKKKKNWICRCQVKPPCTVWMQALNETNVIQITVICLYFKLCNRALLSRFWNAYL
jgi:hypothetical protein